MIQHALVFGLDSGSRVLMSRAVEFTSVDDLRRELEPELDRFAAIEAWFESVCMLRLYADGADR